MEDTDLIKEIESGEETRSTLHINDSKCDCRECRNGKRHYIQLLDMERYVEYLNNWD